MGQHSSKRRSYTPGQDVQSEIPTNSLVNGDVKYDVTANGGIESHDVQMRDPKTSNAVERQNSKSAGKKDKSKKIRIIGMTLRRTPSGRWTRKRRSMRANGSARPASCPVTDLQPKEKGAQPRPQSLFEEEMITEEEGKIETVDLSDNEEKEEAKADQATAGPVPKPREKKVKRAPSDKRQGSKKKKKEKKTSKKEKPKRPTSPKRTKAPDVPVASPDTNKHDKTKPEDAETQNEANDIDQVASSIVQESISIARDRYMSEQENTEECDTPRSDNTTSDASIPVEGVVETPKTVSENKSVPVIDVSPPEVDEDMIIPSQSLVREMVPIIYKVDDSNNDNDDNDQIETSDEKTQEPIEVQVEVVKNENEPEPELEASNLTDVIPSLSSSETKDEEDVVVVEEMVQEKVDRVKTIPVVSVTPPENKIDITNDENETTTETRADNHMDQQTESNQAQNNIPIAAEIITNEAVECVQATPGDKLEEKNDAKEMDSTNDKACENLTEQNPQAEVAVTNFEEDKKHHAKHTREQKEKEKAEKERLKKQKHEEKEKEKERLKEEKRKKAEQKSAEKVKLRGAKSERKSTISKRLSDWFKKDKPRNSESSSTSPAQVDAEDVAGPSGGSAESNVAVATSKDGSGVDSVQSQPNISSELPPDSPANESLTVDVSVQPLPDLSSNETDQKVTPPPSPSDNTSLDSAPVSPVSDDISDHDPTTPTSDGEKGESSGVLKKILLGPRLRTAILRKKSSGASDNGADEKRVSLTQPKGVETGDVTAPPRKLRPRKPVEQYSPVTTGAHNPLKNPSPCLEHKDKDSLPDEPELNTSCHESLPKTDDNVTDGEVSMSVVAELPNVVTKDVEISSQSSHDHHSIENETNVESSNIAVEKSEESSELQSSINVPSEEVIEQSQTQNVSLEALPSLDSATNAFTDKVNEESVVNEVKSEINQNEETEKGSSSNEEHDDSESKASEQSEEIKEEKISPVRSRNKVSTACIVLRTASNEGGEQIDISSNVAPPSESKSVDDSLATPERELEVESLTISELRTEIESSDILESQLKEESLTAPEIQSDLVSAVAGSEEDTAPENQISSKDSENEGNNESDKESTGVKEDASLKVDENDTQKDEVDEPRDVENIESKKIDVEEHQLSEEKSRDVASINDPEVMVCVFDKPDVKLEVSEILANTSGDDKGELSLNSDSEEEKYSQYTVVCTAMAADEKSEDIVASDEVKKELNGDDIKEDFQEHAKDTEETVLMNDEEEPHIDIPQEDASDVSTDNADIIQSSSPPSSSSSTHWESPKLDIQLDDSAIEMDKESPLADTQSPVSTDSSSGISSIKHDDEGVNSDHSSDTNDTGSDGAERNGDDNKKTDSSDTIEAYLKLQQHLDVKDVSPKNHIVDNGGLCESEDLGIPSKNGADDESHGKNKDEPIPQESSTSG